MIDPEQIAGLGIIGVILAAFFSFRGKTGDRHQKGNRIQGVAPGPGKNQAVIPSDRRLTEDEVFHLADSMVRAGLRADQFILTAVARIESSWRPWVTRWEPRINDYSVGLMQTLIGTATWLYTDMGYTAYGPPTMETLKNPAVSMYFGAAYWDWLLRAYPDKNLEWYVRAYNGGPGHNFSAATGDYWRKFQDAAKNYPVGGITIRTGVS